MNFRAVMGILVASASMQSPLVAAAISHAQGELAGEVTSTNILLQTRLTAGDNLINGDVPGADGFAQFEWADNSRFRNSTKSDWKRATADNDFIVRTEAAPLNPATKHFYRVHFGTSLDTTRTGPVRSFTTHGSETDAAPVRFIVANCMNYSFFHNGPKNDGKNAYSGVDKHLGYPAAATILGLNPDFFIGAGDNVYYDHPKKGRAETRVELRKKWHEQFVQPRLVSLLANTAAYWLKDDHDYRVNDSDPTGDYEPSHDLGVGIFREQLPVVSPRDPNAVTYRTIRVGRDLQLWFVEGRDYRSPNNSKDGVRKTIWGNQQREWLQRTLSESDATFKILVSPTPMIGPDDAYKTDNHTNIDGFRHEGDEFFAWLAGNNFPTNRFFILCGDRHWKYHSIHPSGYSEFSCGALNRENSRRGRNPGDANSTDSNAEIVQPYTDPKPLGGFLEVSLDYRNNGPGITFLLRDETGVNRYSKTVR